MPNSFDHVIHYARTKEVMGIASMQIATDHSAVRYILLQFLRAQDNLKPSQSQVCPLPL